jgi:hypothetical protein
MTPEIQSTIIETGASPEWIYAVREKLLGIWGQQACQCPEHWPDVCHRLLEKSGPLVDDAATELARLFNNGPPDDPALACWRIFPRLDRDHCERLAALLIEARVALPARHSS